MHTLDLGHRAGGHRADLAQLRDQIARYAVRDPLTLTWSEDLTLAREPTTAWVYGPAERDPMRTSEGRSAIPRRQLRELKAICRTGLPIQRIAVAHEVELAATRTVLPASQASCRCTDQVARRLVGATPVHPGLNGFASRLDAVIAGVPTRSLRTLLDPIIFGVIAPTRPTQGEPALWIPLVAWRW